MSLTSFVVSRNWRSSRLRTALTLLGIALGTAIVVAIYVMDHNTIQSRMRAQLAERGPVDLEVRPLTGPLEGMVEPHDAPADLRARPGVAAVAAFREGQARARHGEARVDVAVFGIDPVPGGFEHYAVARGNDLAPGAANDVLLGAETSRRLGVGPGDVIRIEEAAGPSAVECRDGKLVVLPQDPGRTPFAGDVTVAGVLTADRLGRRNFGDVAICALPLAEKLAPRGATVFQLRRDYGADLDRLRAELRDRYQVLDLRAAMLGEGADERAFRNGLKVLGCLALVLGMFVVFQTLSHSLVSRVRQLALLRCLGVGPRAVARLFLTDAAALGIAGSLLGVAAGLGLAALLKAYHVSSLGLGKQWSTFEVPFAPVAWTAGLGVLFTLAGAALPLWRARQVAPQALLQSRGLGRTAGDGVDLLRGVDAWLLGLLVVALPLAYLAMTPLASEEGRETLVVLLQLAGMLVGFGAVLLAAPAIVRTAGRALLWPCRLVAPLAAWLAGKVVRGAVPRLAAGICGLAAVLLALLGLKSLTASLRAEVDDFAAAALHERVFLGIDGEPVTPAAARGLAAIPGVAAVEPIEGEVRGAFLLRGADLATAGGAGGALEGEPEALRRYADPKRRGLVASVRLAERMRWQPGDLVPLLDRNGAPVTYEVLLASDRTGLADDERAWAITAPHWLRTDFCIAEACVLDVTLRLAPGADPRLIGDRAKALLRGTAKVKTGAELHDYLRRDVDRDFLLFDVLLLLMLVLAGVGLLNGMTIGALGRGRELGVLRALGTGPRTLRGSFLLEAAVVGVLAAALAIGLAVPVAHVLVAGLNRVAALAAPVVVPSAWLAAAPAIALAVALLTALVPAHAALRRSPGEAVRYE